MQRRQKLEATSNSCIFLTQLGGGGGESDPVVIWRSKASRCLHSFRDRFDSFRYRTRPANVHYFSNAKSSMTSDIMSNILACSN